MSINVTIPNIPEDDAYHILLSSIRATAKAGDKVLISDVISEPFYSAAWRLCIRGVLAQPPTFIQHNYGGVVGARFIVTEYGEKWLSDLSEYDCSPTEYGRFTQFLANHASRLGGGYHARSQEALSCYRAQTFLACCAMCGAAAESITLALAIAKKGDEEEALNIYGRSGGRGKIEKFLLANQDAHITKNIPNYLALLNEWRDVAAHGNTRVVGEDEAQMSLILLLRFARFAVERWDTITRSST